MYKKVVIGIMIMQLIVSFCGCIDDYVEGFGTIQFNDFEGGFYGFVSDDDEKYVPINLPEEFEKEGIRIKYTLKILEDQPSIYQWGVMV